MSTPLKIQRITGISPETAQELRLFAVSWANATRLLHHLIGFTEQPTAMGEALQTALSRYRLARADGLTDIERLGLMLSDMLTAASRLTPDVTPELFAQWCAEHRIPRDAYRMEVQRGRHD